MSYSTERNTKQKIAIFSSIGILIAVGTYFMFTTNNPSVAAAIPALSFAACPAMCVAAGGIMWLSSRFSRNKNNIIIQTPKEQDYCCNTGNSRINKKEQPQQRGIGVFESEHKKDNTSILQQKTTGKIA